MNGSKNLPLKKTKWAKWPQPYSVFFPMGILYALFGVGVWPAFQWMKIPYPSFLHISLMTSGFLLCFIIGFLLTAVPKFTGSSATSKIEFIFIFIFMLWPFPVLLGRVTEIEKFITGMMVTISIFLFSYYLFRRLKAEFRLPLYFDLVGVGLFLFTYGAIVQHAIALGYIEKAWTLRVNRMLHHDFIFFMIAGIGSKMIAALLGWGGQMPVQIMPIKTVYTLERSAFKGFLQSGRLGYLFVSLSFLTLLLNQFSISGFFQLMLFIQIGYFHWKLHQYPRNKGILARWLWFACWALGIGLLVNILFPSLGVHGLHLEMVAGFSLVVLLISSRVILAHGGFGLEFEMKSKLIRVMGLLVILAALTRVVAPWIPGGPRTYVSHLTYAALLFGIALFVWFGAFARKVWP